MPSSPSCQVLPFSWGDMMLVIDRVARPVRMSRVLVASRSERRSGQRGPPVRRPTLQRREHPPGTARTTSPCRPPQRQPPRRHPTSLRCRKRPSCELAVSRTGRVSVSRSTKAPAWPTSMGPPNRHPQESLLQYTDEHQPNGSDKRVCDHAPHTDSSRSMRLALLASHA